MQQYVMTFISGLCQGGGFPLVLLFPQPIKLTPTIYLNSIDSGVKHHNPSPYHGDFNYLFHLLFNL